MFDCCSRCQSSALARKLEGKIVGEYTLTGTCIGTGTFCDVFLAKKNGIDYACKVVHKKKASYDKQVESEISVLKIIKGHANIVTLHHVEDEKDALYIILEFMGGGNLFDVIQSWKVDPKLRGNNQNAEYDAALVCFQIASALAFSHAKGVVHRDIKPENLLLSRKADMQGIKLADFGLAATIEQLKTDKVLVGTPGYIAPEIRLRQPYGGKVDVWSLGILLYVVLLGFMPFASDKRLQLDPATEVHRVFELDNKEPAWKRLSDAGKQALAKMLQPDPSKRVSAADILELPWIKEKDLLIKSSTALRPAKPVKFDEIEQQMERGEREQKKYV